MLQDLRYALRSMARHRGLTAVIVLTLALAIGANTAIFSIMDGLLLRTLPVHNPHSLLLLRWSDVQAPAGMTSGSVYGDCDNESLGGTNTSTCSFSLPAWRALQKQSRTLASLTAFAGTEQDNLQARGEASTIRDLPVAGNYFQVLGLKPMLGRFFSDAPEEMVLSYAFWQRRFGGDRNVVGSSVDLNQHPVTIIGVARPGFPGLVPGSSIDAWIPLPLLSQIQPGWTPEQDGAGSFWLLLAGRARPDIPVAAVQAELNGLFRNLATHGAKPLAKPTDDLGLSVLSAQSGLAGMGAFFRTPLILVFCLVGAVLLIACANIAGLVVGRAQARDKEFAVRRALGAGGGRIARQLLTESLLLALAGGLAGLAVAWVAARALVAMLMSSLPVPMVLAAPLDARVLLFTLAVAVVTGLLFGLAPALRGGRGGSVSLKPRRRWLHLGNGLVVAQVALCMVVLAGAGLLVRTLANLRAVDPGFDAQHLLLFSLDPSSLGYQGGRVIQLFDRVQRGVAALPGVENASYSQFALLSGGYSVGSERMSPKPGAPQQGVERLPVGLKFFTTMRMHLLLGRPFRASDFVPAPAAGAKPNPNAPPRAAVVNALFVKKYLGPGNPIGREFGYDKNGTHPRFTVIAVVNNARDHSLRGAVSPVMYVPNDQGQATFAVRTAGAPMALLPAVRRLIRGIDPDLPVIQPTTEMHTIDGLLFEERMLAQLASLFGVLALFLAAIGLYALLAQEVTRRTREIGIRMARGAQRRQVMRLVVRLGVALAVAGIALGLAGAFAATRALGSILFGIGAMDPLTLSAVGAVLLLVALASCWLPARRATRVDPMVALRYE